MCVLISSLSSLLHNSVFKQRSSELGKKNAEVLVHPREYLLPSTAQASNWLTAQYEEDLQHTTRNYRRVTKQGN